jgi:hypothetical protein
MSVWSDFLAENTLYLLPEYGLKHCRATGNKARNANAIENTAVNCLSPLTIKLKIS